MDARITKQRLANMLSYDWLKIVGVIALAAVAFCVFFMMIATRPTAGQTFYVYAYDGLTAGGDFSRLESDLDSKNVFAYDILKTGSESFSNGGMYGGTVFSARRSAGEGRVMFVNDARTKNEDGKESSSLLDLIGAGSESEMKDFFIDPVTFLSDCEKYLTLFFGEGLVREEPDSDETRAVFFARNGSDKRYRSSAKKEEGVRDEAKRLEKLKEDYLSVKAAVDGGKLAYVTYTGFGEEERTVGFSTNSLHMSDLVFYTVKNEEDVEVKTNRDIALCIFNNGDREGDLKYETVNFLAYLLRTYGTAQ